MENEMEKKQTKWISSLNLNLNLDDERVRLFAQSFQIKTNKDRVKM